MNRYTYYPEPANSVSLFQKVTKPVTPLCYHMSLILPSHRTSWIINSANNWTERASWSATIALYNILAFDCQCRVHKHSTCFIPLHHSVDLRRQKDHIIHEKRDRDGGNRSTESNLIIFWLAGIFFVMTIKGGRWRQFWTPQAIPSNEIVSGDW